MLYRRSRNTPIWHYCTNCSEWPTANYYDKNERPSDGELCRECEAKLLRQECNALSR